MAHRMSDPHLELAEDSSSLQEVYEQEFGPEEVRPLLSSARVLSDAPLHPFTSDYGSSSAGLGVLKIARPRSYVDRLNGWSRESELLKARSWTLSTISSRSSRARRYTLIALCMAMLLSASIYLFIFSGMNSSDVPERDSTTGGPFFPAAIQNSWGAYTPYFPVKPYPPPPSHCKITQVNLIQRHGARFPTSGASARIEAALQRLQAATEFLDPKLKFLANYTYSLGQNELLDFGAKQSFDSGKEAYDRYASLISLDNLPFVRASLSSRVIESANNWTAGFAFASDDVCTPVLSVVMDEKLNDTLDDAMCPNAGSSDAQTATWTSLYGPPIAARLNAQAPGATVTADDISNLIPLCAFETLATEAPSPFCDIFSPEEFAQYEYNSDLDKYYNTGYGQPLGPVQGVGYINELLARLTETPVRDNTQTNRTLDSSPITFPLNRTFYADFSHDNQMVAIYSAMGLFKQSKPLDPTKIDAERTWITSRLTPFSGRMVVERLSCEPSGKRATMGLFGRRLGSERTESKEKNKAFVRILVNDALQPLEFCGGDGDGLCTLDAFLQSQAYARNDGNGDFEKCFA